MSNYYSITALSCSALKDFAISPKYYYEKWISKTIPFEKTSAMDFGTAVHLALLEPHLFDEKVIVVESKLTKEAKAKKDQGILLSCDEKDKLDTMCDNFFASSASQILKDAKKEVEFFSKWHSISVKGKMDAVIPPCEKFPEGVIIDIKTTSAGDLKEIQSSIVKYKYHLQAAFYSKLFYDLYSTYPTFIFIFLEKERAQESRFFVCTENFLEIGRVEMEDLLHKYKSFSESNFQLEEASFEMLDLPAWYKN